MHHNERKGARYVCTTDIANLSNKNCIAFSNMRIDAAVSAEVLRAVSPLAMEGALQLIADHEQAGAERLRQCELALEQARYEAMHARRQYDAVDPLCGVRKNVALSLRRCSRQVIRCDVSAT